MRSSHFGFGASVALAMCIVGAAAATMSADVRDDSDHRLYLALGDSVAFAYIAQAGYEYLNPDNFFGYAEYVERTLHLKAVDAGCPGETTGSFLSSDAVDDGCREYRSLAPLHVGYAATQMGFATDLLQAHPETRLVTITLGANDLFVLERTCGGDPTCIRAHLPEVLAAVTANMETILSQVQATGFHGAIAVTNYYSLDYNDPLQTAIVSFLNEALAAAAAANGAVVADLFGAYLAASSNPFANGSPCKAGLLNALPGDQFKCDVHPSQSGHRLIADTIRRAVRPGHETD